MTSGEMVGPFLGLTWAVLEGFWANARQSFEMSSVELREVSVAFFVGGRQTTGNRPAINRQTTGSRPAIKQEA
jgi:hypothetical protein